MFNIPELESFMKEIKSYNIPLKCVLIMEDVLTLLDREPRTSSVAITGGPIITGTPKRGHNTYTLLAGVALWDHSLNTAKALISETHETDRHGIDFGAEIIAAIGHDIGKLLAYRPHPYKKGDHPIVGARVLLDIIGNRLPGYLPDFIAEAVRFHHETLKFLDENGYAMAKKLALADWQARSRELSRRRQELMK